MPRKTKHIKRTYKKRPYKKRTTKNTRMTVIRTTHHMPIAPKMKIAFEQTVNGFFSLGSASGVAYLGLSYLNGLNGGPISNATAVLPNLITSTIASYPVGFATYMDPLGSGNTLYSQCIVYGCRITITLTPQSVVDISEFSITPVDTRGGQSGAGISDPTVDIPYGSVAAASQAPYGKSLMITSNNNIRQNTLSSYVDVAKFFGVTKKILVTDDNYIHSRFLSDDDDNVLASPPRCLSWQINYQSADNTALTTNLCYKINVKYYCILQHPATVGLSV